MQKIMLIIIVAILVVMSSADDKITIPNKYDKKYRVVKGCSEPYKEYVHFYKRSETSIDADDQDRWREIANAFLSHYKKCVQGINNKTINKSNKYQTFKQEEDRL
jgi:hypothetical protein